MNLVTYTAAMRRALHVENLSATTYAAALLLEAGVVETITGLAHELGLSPKGIRDCVSRRASDYFKVDWGQKPGRVTLTPAGRMKLAAVARHLPTSKPKRRRRATPATDLARATQLSLSL